MTKGGKIAVAVGITIAVVAVTHYLTRMTKDRALDIIVKAREGRKRSSYDGFDEWFLKEWATAIRDGESSWVSKSGKTHSTDTAKVVR
jgi:hypothetical protein